MAVTVLILINTVVYMMGVVVNYCYTNNPWTLTIPDYVIYNIGFYASFSSFNTAHWLFASHYWAMSIRLRLLFRGEDWHKSDRKLCCLKWTGIIYIQIAEVFFSLSWAIDWGKYWQTTIAILSFMSLFVSCLFLFSAVTRIR